MPSDQSTWLLAIPNDGDAEGVVEELHTKLGSGSKPSAYTAQLLIPSFKVVPSSRVHQRSGELITRDLPDRNLGLARVACGRDPKAGHIFHCDSSQDRRHIAKPAEQRPVQASPARAGQ